MKNLSGNILEVSKTYFA